MKRNASVFVKDREKNMFVLLRNENNPLFISNDFIHDSRLLHLPIVRDIKSTIQPFLNVNHFAKLNYAKQLFFQIFKCA